MITLGGETSSGSDPTTGGGSDTPEDNVTQPAVSADDLTIGCLSTTLDSSVPEGGTVNPLFQVTNPTQSNVTAEVETLVDGRAVGTTSVTVPANSTTSSRQQIQLIEAGERDIGFRVVSVS